MTIDKITNSKKNNATRWKIKDKRQKIKVENRGRFNAKAKRCEGKTGEICPLITRMNTNEYFAVNLILHHKIKFTASVSVLLVPISAISG